MTHRRSSVLALVLLMVLLAACGQKPGVHVEGFAGENGLGPGETVGPGGGPTTGPGGGPTTGPGGGPTTGPGGGPTSGPNAPSGPGTRIGIDEGGKKEIRIGVHAPLSGAAPISPQAFRAGADTYWRGKTVHGRTVRVYVEDDGYSPSQAQSKCNDMAVRDRVFLLIGAAGTDQILTCAKYSERNKIPYFSAGVQETGLSGLQWYSALTMTYAQQMPLLAQYIKSLGAAEDKYSTGGVQAADGIIKLAFVRPNTPNFADAQSAFSNAISALTAPSGKRYEVIIKVVNKEGSPSDATNVANDAKNRGVDIMVPITAPSFTAVNLAAQTGGQQYFPRYVGVGVTNGVNQAIAQACRQRQWEGAMFFSPWPGWANRNSFDKSFDAAANGDPDARQYNTKGNGGDILLAIYGIMKTMHGVLEQAGASLSRESVQSMMNGYAGGSGGFFPDLQFSAANPFGAKNVHALLGDCDNTEFTEHPQHFGLKRNF